ncbi:MAG: site-specific integrase, partial [Planctomycetes bacterium]|nr:site-specific integrase [Planctomycetota bacterium]
MRARGPEKASDGDGKPAGEPAPSVPPSPLADAANAFLAHLADAREASAHTLRAYRHELDRLLGWLAREAPDAADPRTLDARTLRAFVLDRAGATPAPAPRTVARAVASLRAFGRYLAASGRAEA